jgi:hypothetical protein
MTVVSSRCWRRAPPLPACPPGWARTWGSGSPRRSATAVARGEMAARTLAMLATAFSEAAVPYFATRGSVLAHEVYGAPERRRFSDIDVVVRPPTCRAPKRRSSASASG